jgi:DUF2971 family protein
MPPACQAGDGAPESFHCGKDFLQATSGCSLKTGMEPSDPLDSLRSERPASPLYHYTSPAGLLGIIESKSLWASGIQYLNDTAEFKHAAAIAHDLLTQYLENENDPFKDLYRLLLRGGDAYLDSAVFVCSLSEAKDKLSQWRAYCATGGGFSIGFDAALIERQAKKQDFQLLKCEYDPDKQKAICAALILAGCRDAQWAVQANQQDRKTTKEQFQTIGLWHGFVEPIM